MHRELVSVVILNYRRRDALVRTLESARAQTYAPREVIVVDNGSGDDTPAFLRASFPEVRVVALEENIGCGARNFGVEAARGELVVTIDNDVYFDSPFELQKVVNTFAERPEASFLAFKVLEAQSGQVHLRDWCHPRSCAEFADTEFETCYIPEGACAFRRHHFLEAGGYFQPFWIGCEGWDLALRLLNRGRRIVYAPSVRVRHLMSKQARASWRPFYYYTRNYVWIAWRNYRARHLPWYLGEKLAMMLYFGVRTGNLAAVLRGLWQGFRGLPKLAGTRRPLSPVAWSNLQSLLRERPGLVARLRKHWERPLI